MVIQMNKVSSPVDILRPLGDNSRDPMEVNKYIQAGWSNVIGEPDGLRSPDWAWKFSMEVFTFVQACTYRFLVIILGPLISFIAAILFGVLHFLQIWCARPITKFFHVVFSTTRIFLEITLSGTFGPIFESIGQLCSRFKIRHQRVYDAKDEPIYPFII